MLANENATFYRIDLDVMIFGGCRNCTSLRTDQNTYKVRSARKLTYTGTPQNFGCERGCAELIELVRLEAHSHTCKYKPATCPNEKCAKIINLADLEQHTSEVCEYRQVYCD